MSELALDDRIMAGAGEFHASVHLSGVASVAAARWRCTRCDALRRLRRRFRPQDRIGARRSKSVFRSLGASGPDAKKDFGIAAVDYKVPAEWKLSLQIELLESLAAQGYSGIGLFPSNASGVNATLAELKSADIQAVALGGCAADPTAVAFCLATDPFKASYFQARKAIEAIGGHGNLVHLTGELLDTNTALREQGVQKAVDETEGAVKLVQTLADTDDPEAGDQKINALLAARKDQIDGIVATAYVTSVVTARSLRAINDHRIKFIAFNDDPSVLDAIRDGFATGTVVQNPYGQAYVGAYALDLLAGGGCTIKADAPWAATPQTSTAAQ